MSAFANTPKRSGSIISGNPSFASLFEFYDNNYISMLTSAMDQVLSEFERDVRNKARATWGDLADSISIEFNPSTFEVTYSASPEAEALEYGSVGQSPTAVLRNAAIAASQELPYRIAARMSGKK